MIVKGYLVNDVDRNEVEVVLDPKSMDEIKKDYLRELLEATIKHVVCPEYLDLFEDVDDWYDYKQELLAHPEELFRAFVEGEVQDAIEEKAEEVYQDNKPQYFPVDVQISCRATIYIKARTRDQVDDVMRGYALDAEDILSDVGGADYEIDDFWIGDSVDDETYIRYETVYDAEDYI